MSADLSGSAAEDSVQPPRPEPTAPPILEVHPDGREYPLDPRHVTVERISGWIAFAVISGPTFVGLLVTNILAPLSLDVRLAMVTAWVFVAGWLVWGAQWWPPIAHRYASYRVDEEVIEIKRGVVWRRVITIPRSRVQHTDVSQGPLERSYGLGTLVIFTAGTEHARVTLGGLDHARALKIRDHLLASEGADAV
jgi:membrane protein YdbS with pleckstrin-like domain